MRYRDLLSAPGCLALVLLALVMLVLAILNEIIGLVQGKIVLLVLWIGKLWDE